MLLVFAINTYLGLADSNLRNFNVAHYYLDWLIVAVSLMAAVMLFLRPRSKALVILSGIVWPTVYLGSLAVDVLTRLCLGASSTSCWPSRSAAFDYLILNRVNISNAPGYGWKLLPGVMPLDISLLLIVLIISVTSVLASRSNSQNTRSTIQQQLHFGTGE